MNKFQFIKELLDTKKFNPHQKERFFKLVSNELGKVEDQDRKVLGDIQLIKKKIGLVDDETPVNYTVNFNDLDSDDQDELWNDMAGATNTNGLISKKDKPNPDIHEDQINDGLKALLASAHRPSNIADKSDKNKVDLYKLLMDSASTEIPAKSTSNPLLGEFNGQVENERNIGTTGLDMEEAKSDSQGQIKQPILNYLNPLHLTQFIHDFNQNPILKSTWHLIDRNELTNILTLTNNKEYNFKNHKRSIEHEYFLLTKKYDNRVNSKIRTQIGEYLNNYLKSNKGWSEDKILITWSSDEVASWCSQNPGKCPNPYNLGYEGCPIPPLTLKNGEVLNNFSDIVNQFKRQIQFRSDHSLKETVEGINFNYRDKADFNTDSMRQNLQLFTDTEKVRQAYRKIIEMSLEHFKKKEVRPHFDLSFYEKDDQIIFSINNINSIFGKTMKDAERLGADFTGLIKNQINGLCDLTLKADFGFNEFGKVFIWPKKKAENLQEFKGVEFNLIFYRAK